MNKWTVYKKNELINEVDFFFFLDTTGQSSYYFLAHEDKL